MEEWNVEALAEIPLQREKNGKMECWNVGMLRRKPKSRFGGRRMECWKNGRMWKFDNSTMEERNIGISEDAFTTEAR